MSNAQISLSNGEVFTRTTESLQRLNSVTAKKVTRLKVLSETSVSNIDGNEVKNLYEDVELVTTHKVFPKNQTLLEDFLAQKKQFYLSHLPKKSNVKSTIDLDELWNQEKNSLKQKNKREKEEKKHEEIESAEQRKKFQKEKRINAQVCSNINTLSSEKRIHISKHYLVSYSSIKLLRINYSPIFGCQFVVDTSKGVKNVFFNDSGGGEVNGLLSD
ncbi:hypothetical protein N9351_01595 [Candidatus Thioglobus sp.]|nr:hypothetical protein [Candidatus Thioglobus sp.]